MANKAAKGFDCMLTGMSKECEKIEGNIVCHHPKGFTCKPEGSNIDVDQSVVIALKQKLSEVYDILHSEANKKLFAPATIGPIGTPNKENITAMQKANNTAATAIYNLINYSPLLINIPESSQSALALSRSPGSPPVSSPGFRPTRRRGGRSKLYKLKKQKTRKQVW